MSADSIGDDPAVASAPPPGGEGRFCSTTDAARMLGLSNTTVQGMVERGELKAWKTRGGHRRILVESVERVAAMRGAPPSARARGEQQAVVLDVLVVEDDAALRDVYARTIGGWGLPVRVTAAADGMEALLLIERQRPDLLVADLQMRPMDGFELLRMLRQHREFDAMMVVAVTGLDEAEIDARGGVPRGTVVYPKPVPFEKLQGFIESTLLRKQLA
jgi:excisionase family DNA binding protein